MWWPELPVLEKIVRAAVVYLFLLVALRLTGKRQVGQMTPFDLIVLLVISNVMQNAMIGNDNSVLGGLIGGTTIFALNGVVARFSYHSRAFERLVDGEPTRLITDGRVDEEAMRRELVTRADLDAALREAGMMRAEDAGFAMLESHGRISAGTRRD